jgi:hypothetical protein
MRSRPVGVRSRLRWPGRLLRYPGDVGETWFTRNGHVFQLSVVAPDRELQDAWLRDLTAHLSTGDALLP